MKNIGLFDEMRLILGARTIDSLARASWIHYTDEFIVWCY